MSQDEFTYKLAPKMTVPKVTITLPFRGRHFLIIF